MKEPKIDKEKRLTLEMMCEMLGVNKETHWIRVIHEQSRDYPSFCVRIQAISRTNGR